MRALTLFAPSDVATPEPPQLGSRRREDVPDRFKWNLSDIFPDWTAWEAGYKQLESGIDRYAALKGTLAGGPDALLTAFRLSEELGQLAYRVWYYPSLQYDEDQRDNAINAQASAGANPVRAVGAGRILVQPRIAVDSARHRPRMDGAVRAPPALPVRHRESLPPAGARAGRSGREADVAVEPAFVVAQRRVLGAVHGRRQIPDDHALDRESRSPSHTASIVRCWRRGATSRIAKQHSARCTRPIARR